MDVSFSESEDDGAFLDELSDFSEVGTSLESGSEEFTFKPVEKLVQNNNDNQKETNSSQDVEVEAAEEEEEDDDDEDFDDDFEDEENEEDSTFNAKQLAKTQGASAVLDKLATNPSCLRDALEALVEPETDVVSVNPRKAFTTLLPLVSENESAEIGRLVCSLIGILSFCDTNKISIAKHGGAELVLNFLKGSEFTSNSELLCLCIETLSTLAQPEENRITLVELGCVEALAPIMDIFQGREQIQACGCRLLQVLSSESKTHQVLVESGCPSILTGSLQRFARGSSEVCTFACATVYQLEEEFVRMTRNLAFHDHAEIIQHLLRILCEIARTSSTPKETKGHALTVLARIFSTACFVYTSQETLAKEGFLELLLFAIDSNIVEAAVETMTDLSDDSEVLSDGVSILYSALNTSEEVQQAIYDRAAVQVLKDIMNAAVLAMGVNIKSMSSDGDASIQDMGQQIISVLSEELQHRLESPVASPNEEHESFSPLQNLEQQKEQQQMHAADETLLEESSELWTDTDEVADEQQEQVDTDADHGQDDTVYDLEYSDSNPEDNVESDEEEEMLVVEKTELDPNADVVESENNQTMLEEPSFQPEEDEEECEIATMQAQEEEEEEVKLSDKEPSNWRLDMKKIDAGASYPFHKVCPIASPEGSHDIQVYASRNSLEMRSEDLRLESPENGMTFLNRKSPTSPSSKWKEDAEVALLRKENQDKEAQFRALAEEKERQLSDLRSIIQDHESELDRIRLLAKETEIERNDLRAISKNQEQEISQLRALTQEKQASLKSLQQGMERFDTNVALLLNSRRAQSTVAKIQYQWIFRANKARISRLKSKLAQQAFEQQSQDLANRSELDATGDKIEELQQMLSKERNARAVLEGELASLRMDKVHSDDAFSELEAALGKVKDLENELQQARRDFLQTKEENKTLREEVVSNEDRLEETEMLNRTLSQRVKALEHEHSRVEQKLAQSQQEIQSLQKELMDRNVEVSEEHERQVEGLQSTIKNLSHQQEQAAKEHNQSVEMLKCQLENEYRMVIKAMSASRSRLEERHEATKAENIQLTGELVSLRERVRLMQEQLDQGQRMITTNQLASHSPQPRRVNSWHPNETYQSSKAVALSRRASTSVMDNSQQQQQQQHRQMYLGDSLAKGFELSKLAHAAELQTLFLSLEPEGDPVQAVLYSSVYRMLRELKLLPPKFSRGNLDVILAKVEEKTKRKGKLDFVGFITVLNQIARIMIKKGLLANDGFETSPSYKWKALNCIFNHQPLLEHLNSLTTKQKQHHHQRRASLTSEEEDDEEEECVVPYEDSTFDGDFDLPPHPPATNTISTTSLTAPTTPKRQASKPHEQNATKALNRLWSKERKPLRDIFDHYAKQERDTTSQQRSSLDKRTQVHVTHSGIRLQAMLQMATDFDIIPSLYGRTEVRKLFNKVLGEANRCSGTNYPSLGFDSWLEMLEQIAVSKFPGPVGEAGGAGDSQVAAIMQWMDASNGKVKLRDRGRSGVLVRKFSLSSVTR